MVEVFKTNVTAPGHAQRLLDRIHATFAEYRANFDLEDCDNILRVECASGFVLPSCLIRLLRDAGFHAEVLPD
ncbi:hypothetical protein [Hymenobacter algoricola]|uniref:Uncharacterized protein n=1 Tax=Hymenobacter algoricola TaxID=486267 RepID=A0ABP7N2X7_9BACT